MVAGHGSTQPQPTTSAERSENDDAPFGRDAPAPSRSPPRHQRLETSSMNPDIPPRISRAMHSPTRSQGTCVYTRQGDAVRSRHRVRISVPPALRADPAERVEG